MKITLSQDKLRDGAQRLKTYLANKNITRNGKPIGVNFCQQILTIGLLDKPFEEVLTLLDSPESTKSNGAGVFILTYGSEQVIAYRTLSGNNEPELEYYTSRSVGTDMELSENEIERQAQALANTRNTSVAHIELPEILHDDWQPEDVLALAIAMRYHETSNTLLDALSDTSKKIFIDGHYINHGLSDEWFRELPDTAEELYEDGDPSLSDILSAVTAWMPEYTDEDYNLYEYFFSVNDLVNAAPVPDCEDKWHIEQNGEGDTKFYLLVSLH